MSREIYWTTEAVRDLDYWKKNKRNVAVRVAKLVASVQNDPYKGIGKPEPLRFSLTGKWSRRITKEHRLVYEVSGEVITIISCRFHY
jgi:toxin YoeB